MPLSRGQTFAGYRIVRLLGSGGMGEVYLAQHPRLPRHNAIKVLPADVSADPDYRARFEREADLASKLWHPHIVSVHDRGDHDGQLWISMDFVDGRDAARLLEGNPSNELTTEQVARIVTAVASALDYAHKQGLLHRDVKPANIMLTHLDDADEQRVLLTDFGIARNLGDISGLTATNMTMGTVAYAAPEQLMGEDLDGRADQYALAATAYQLLTGSTPFPHTNPAVIISRHLTSPPPALSNSRPELAHLDAVFAQALAKNPAHRFARCMDFARAVEQAASGGAPAVATTAMRPLATPSAKAGSTTPPVESSDRASSRRPRLLVAAALGATVVLAGAGALVWHPWTQSPDSTTASSVQPATSAPGGIAAPTSTTTPPPPATFAAKAIDDVLLGPSEVNDVLDTYAMSGDKKIGVMKVDRSTYGMTDNSSLVKPSSCVGVVFGAEHNVYADTRFSAIHDETFDREPYVYNPSGSAPTALEQTAIVFPSEAAADLALASAQKQWRDCAAGQVDQRAGPESGYRWNFGAIQHRGDVMSLKMASNGAMNGAAACQQALGIRANVIVTTRACNDVTQSPGFDEVHDTWPTNPEWANNDAARLADAMLAKIKV
ncbi:MAG TPA: serine/threonine-protein kinase PknH/PknJ [Mycobacterium sp.]|nr:serine/threonine-protein kinase PknH/PknJ [Mycobacterium sp.]